MSTLDQIVVSSITAFTSRVDDRISALLCAEKARWSAVSAATADPLVSLEQLVMAGGKRLRPSFCYWAFVGAGGDAHDSRIVDAASALELLHCFALVHDDVMDDSPCRRGRPSVHADYEARHIGSGWRGESRRFGEGMAVLVGDLAFVYADLLMAQAPLQAIGVFTELRLEANMGQYLDLLGAAKAESDPEGARLIRLYKSAKYTVERPLHLGAAIGGRLADLKPVLSSFGLPLGEAFQLRDDLLGAFGDPGLTGKPVGGDIQEGKPTALYAFAKERSSGVSAKALDKCFGAKDLSASEVEQVQAIFEETGARAAVEDRIAFLLDEAVGALQGSALLVEAQEALIELAYFAANRDH